MRGAGAATAYGERVTRSPAFLAALASSAVPGLDPVTVRAARPQPGHRYEVAFVSDSQRRTWVVRVPVTSAAGAQMDTTVALLGLLGRRLPFSVPTPRGFVGVPEGRAVVYPYLQGRPVDFAALPPGPGLAAELGRAVAALHNIDRAVFDEAGLPAYEAEDCRTRQLADLDRGAATGHVPTTVLSRWERVLEDVSVWRFAPTPVHGGLTGDRVLVTFTDEEDATSGTVRAITGWDEAKVADPADDLATLLAECKPATFETVLEAYAHSRVERPDRHLPRRARLAGELRLLTGLLAAVSSGNQELVEAYAVRLRSLAERADDGDELSSPVPHQTSADAGASSPRTMSAEPLGEGAAVTDGEALTGAVGDAGEAEGLGTDDDTDGPEDRNAGEREDGPADDAAGANDTDADAQPLRTGLPGDATTVIPHGELERLRRSREVPAPEEAGSAQEPPSGEGRD